MIYVNTPVLRLAPQFVILTGTLDHKVHKGCDLEEDLGLQINFSSCYASWLPSSRISFPLPSSHRDMWPHYSSKAMCQSRTETSRTVLQDTCFSLWEWILSDISHGDVKRTDTPAKLLLREGPGIYILKLSQVTLMWQVLNLKFRAFVDLRDPRDVSSRQTLGSTL